MNVICGPDSPESSRTSAWCLPTLTRGISGFFRPTSQRTLLNSCILAVMFKTIRFLQDTRLAGSARSVPTPEGFPQVGVCDQWIIFEKGQTKQIHSKSLYGLTEGIDFEFVDSD